MHGICDICNKPKKTVNKNKKTKQLVCHYCYVKYFHKRLCSKCNEVKSAAKRLPDDTYLCDQCGGYHGSGKIGTCSVCNEIKPVRKNLIDGFLRCSPCHNKSFRSVVCVRCGNDRIIAKLTENGPVCGTCYKKTLLGFCVDCNLKKTIHAKKRCPACYRRWLRKQKKLAL
ncbi:MAG: hypothetical protein AAB575_04540 [Patescibacteria group bacterium]